jgi:hypothetical protein
MHTNFPSISALTARVCQPSDNGKNKTSTSKDGKRNVILSGGEDFFLFSTLLRET